MNKKRKANTSTTNYHMPSKEPVQKWLYAEGRELTEVWACHKTVVSTSLRPVHITAPCACHCAIYIPAPCSCHCAIYITAPCSCHCAIYIPAPCSCHCYLHHCPLFMSLCYLHDGEDPQALHPISQEFPQDRNGDAAFVITVYIVMIADCQRGHGPGQRCVW